MIGRWVGKFGEGFQTFVNRNIWVCFFILIFLAGFNFFFGISTSPILEWDEARNGVSAYEMIRNGNYIVSSFWGKPDLWNLKPPLGSWLIILGYKIWGLNALGLRFFTALSALSSVTLIFLVTRRKVGNLAGLVSGTMLATTIPFVIVHGARTGDYSAILVFLALISFFCVDAMAEKPAFLYLVGLIFALAFLLYGAASFQIPIWMAVYFLFSGKWRNFSVGQYVGFLFCALSPILLWVFWRLQSPEGEAFLKKMLLYDLVKRSTEAIEEQQTNPFFYLRSIVVHNRYWVFFMLIIGFLFRKYGGKMKGNELILLAGTAVIVPYILFSLAQTRLVWYVYPTYGPLTIIIGWLTWYVLSNRQCKAITKGAVFFLFLVVVLKSEHSIVKRMWQPTAFAQNLIRELKDVSGANIYGKKWSQDRIFTAEVERGLFPVALEKTEDCLGKSGFALLEKTSEDQDFVVKNRLRIEFQNEKWMILRLP